MGDEYDEAADALVEATKAQLLRAIYMYNEEESFSPSSVFGLAVYFLKKYNGNRELLELLAELLSTLEMGKLAFGLITAGMPDKVVRKLLANISALGDVPAKVARLREEISFEDAGDENSLVVKIRKTGSAADDEALLKFVLAIWSINDNAYKLGPYDQVMH